MWGVRDHASVAEYGDAVLGGRRAIPEMLRLFSQYGVRATWATVGLLFARTRSDMLEYSPEICPDYDDVSLSNYSAIVNVVGQNEDEDPLHFGRSLVDRIAAADGQEIATHTFSHYYCLEHGSTIEAFEADLKSARAIAKAAGHQMESIVFPRNQYSEAYISVCRVNGITAYRGQPDAFAYRPAPKTKEGRLRRGVRLLDSILPVVPRRDEQASATQGGVVDVKASHFLRPSKKSPPILSGLQLRRILQDMRAAAIGGHNFHLWWHPHNFGRHSDENLFNLEQILKEFIRLRDQHAMESMNMSDIARRVNQGPSV